MANRVLLTFLGADFLFLLSGILILVVSLVFKPTGATAGSATDVATGILLQLTPLTGAVVNAVFIFITFIVSLPGAFMARNRVFLKVHSWLVLFCGLLSLILGLDIWFSTLKTRANLSVAWGQQTPQMQSMLQQEFACCGYLNPTTPPFVTDTVCRDAATAVQLGGCVTPFSTFANNLLDIVFTAMFGIVALDAVLFLSTIVVLKDRAEKERYRLIDAKSGFAGI